MTEPYIPNRDALHSMNRRYNAGGEEHEDQVVMSVVGALLARYRTNKNISVETVAAKLGKEPDYIARAEEGVILPDVFFPMLSAWAAAVGISKEQIDHEIDLVQHDISIDQKRKRKQIAAKYHQEDLDAWVEVGQL